METVYPGDHELQHGFDKFPPDGGDVKLSYVYSTPDAYEAEKASIPIGARVVKLYEYPVNQLYYVNRPDLWPVAAEVDLGGGLYGGVIAGTMPDWSSGWVNWNSGYSVGANHKLQNAGGYFDLSVSDRLYLG